LGGYYPGFKYNTNWGEVTEIFITEETSNLKIGDIITRIRTISLEDYLANPNIQLWGDLEPGDAITIHVIRDRQSLEIEWIYTGFTQEELFYRLNSQWWLSYLCWFAGLAAFLIIRPRDTVWLLFIAFTLLTAVWFTAGSGPSRLHLWGSAIVSRVGVWMAVPVMIHLHWIFPKRFEKVPIRLERILLGSLYALSCVFIALCFIYPKTSSLYIYGLLLSLTASALLLIFHYFLQKEVRTQISIIFRVTVLAFLPIILVIFLGYFTPIPDSTQGMAVVGLPLIPFSYLYAIWRGKLGAFEFRANRAISLYLFMILMIAVLLLIFTIPDYQSKEHGTFSVVTLGIGLITALVSIYYFPKFQRFIEKRVLGIPLHPNELLQSYTAQITTSQDTAGLSAILGDLILPSLMVRQSALISIFGHSNFSVLDFRGLQKEQLPTREHISELLEMGGKYIPPHKIRRFPRHLHWIKVILPLTFDNDIIGLWLLGRRDPNDVYGATLIEMLHSLANQTSIALVNHRQTQNLRALYQANIDRHENERASLARELHDDTLNNLALLQRETKNQDLTHDIENIIAKLRKTIRGLRPEMLTYGLMTALQDLGDTLNERQSKTEVLVALEGIPAPTNIAQNIELHLFRVVQQACENALLHALAKNLKIMGEISESGVNIRIEDNGVGFETGRSLMLSDLLTNKHYGLAGMHERADLIGAKINIQSTPGKGTTILIEWQQQ